MSTFAGAVLRETTVLDVDPVHLREMLTRYGLLVVDGQDLDEEGFWSVLSRLGRMVPPPFLEEVTRGTGVSRLEHSESPNDLVAKQRSVFASGWHNDWTFLEIPPVVSALYCESAPLVGGDTLFCDTSYAMSSFSPKVRDLYRDLRAVHSSSKSFSKAGAYGAGDPAGASLVPAAPLMASHPMICHSSLSQEECFLANPAYVHAIEELSPIEASTLLGMAYNLLFRDENQIRIRWSSGMLVLWDNYRFMHRALDQGVEGTRRLLRANIV